MRVLLVHSHYRTDSPSGELQVFLAEKKLLESNGFQIDTFELYSDKFIKLGPISKILASILICWNPFTYFAIRRKIAKFNPDVVHVHNIFPWISAAIFYAIKRPVVRILTLHNYRIVCPAAIPARQGKVCVECIDRRSVWPAVRHACYRGNRMATLPLAASVALHRKLGTWTKQVDAFIALSEFQKEMMIDAGLPADRIYIKPNFVNESNTPKPWVARKNRALFVGRLSEEKGIITLIKAWALWGDAAPELYIIGDGIIRSKLEAMAKGLKVHFLGSLSNEETRASIADSRLLLVPSEWFEGFAIVLIEGFSLGTPVAASNIGPLPFIVQDEVNGIIFKPNDPEALYNKISKVYYDNKYMKRISLEAHKSYTNFYNPEVNLKQLTSIYRQTIEKKRNG
jgi:glycosyltransferase involved in cell wall biosynthesis